MKESNKQQIEPKDNSLDIPAEANREKHINFLERDEESSTENNGAEEDRLTERQKEWKEGLEEGKQARRANE